MPSSYAESLAVAFERLEQAKKAEGERFKAIAYGKAARTVREVLPRSSADLKGKAGFGKSLLAKAVELEESGEVAAAEQVRVEAEAITNLTSVYGIGTKKAKDLMDAGIKTVQQLREALKKDPKLLNANQKTGLEYVEDMALRIPREEMVEHDEVLRRVADGVFAAEGAFAQAAKEFEVAGSYRRGAETSGDIDFLVKGVEGEGEGLDTNRRLFDEVMRGLKEAGYVVASFSKGDEKFMGMCRLRDDLPARRLDVSFASESKYPFMKLYFTGSKEYNIEVRRVANDQGYKLNQKGFQYIGKDPESAEAAAKREAIRTEKDILDFLGLPWKEPSER